MCVSCPLWLALQKRCDDHIFASDREFSLNCGRFMCVRHHKLRKMEAFMIFGSLMAAVALAAGVHADGQNETESAALAEALAGFERSGETRVCLSTYRIDQITPVDDNNWLVTTRGNDTFLNTVSRGCQNADSNFSFLQYRSNGRLCRGDIVQVVASSTGLPEGSCSLGSYELLTPVE